MDFTGVKEKPSYRLIGHSCLNSNPHGFGSTWSLTASSLSSRRETARKKGTTTTPCDFTSCLLLALLPVDILIVSSFLISSDPATSNSSQPHQLEQNIHVPKCLLFSGGDHVVLQLVGILKIRSTTSGKSNGSIGWPKKNVKNASSLSPWNLTFESLKFFVAPRVTDLTSED